MSEANKTSSKFVALLGVLFVALLNSAQAEDNKFIPSALLKLDSYFSHHVLLAEKSTHTLYLYENKGGLPQLVKSFQMATGKKAGDKVFQGDFRTPEGVYSFTQFIPNAELIERYGKEGEIYGVGSFVMNYPNPIDKRVGKTGGGIWLHSTNDETRIDKGLDSRGCLVTANQDLKDISTFIELNRTSVVVVHDVEYLAQDNYLLTRQDIVSTIEDWAKAWREEDKEKYLSFYHKTKFIDPVRGGYQSFAKYKRAVFSNPGQPEIKVDNVSVLSNGDYVVATFTQDYKSNTISDLGKKTLYLERDEFYQWKIVSEVWSKHGVSEYDERVAFQPSMRFFKDGDNNTQEAKGSN